MSSSIFLTKKQQPTASTISPRVGHMKRIQLILLSFLVLVSCQSGAQQNSNANLDNLSLNQPNVEQDTCFLNVGKFEWFSLQIVMTLYSTHKQEGTCDKKRYDALTLASTKAQLLGVQKFDFVIRGGHYHYLMDANLSPVQNQFYMIGSMRFSPSATIKISILEFLLGQKSIEELVINASYKPFSIAADVHYVWDIGSKAHQLVDPEGRTYIMMSYTTDVYPELNPMGLNSLRSKLALPKGWKYETIVLDKTVKIRGSKWSSAHRIIIFDDFGNMYVKYE